jgi:hypothetical protein
MATKKAKKAAAEALATAPDAGADEPQDAGAQTTAGPNIENPHPTDSPLFPHMGDVVHVVRADGTKHEGVVFDIVLGYVVRLKDGADTELFVREEALTLAPRKG